MTYDALNSFFLKISLKYYDDYEQGLFHMRESRTHLSKENRERKHGVKEVIESIVHSRNQGIPMTGLL